MFISNTAKQKKLSFYIRSIKKIDKTGEGGWVIRGTHEIYLFIHLFKPIY